MTRYPFMQVDAFTKLPLAGNPCAVVFEADDLNDPTMLSIAREMNLSETAFVTKSSSCDFGARYFTPVEEIPLAGHPTIATVHALVETGRIEFDGEVHSLTLELIEGPIHVDIIRERDAIRIVMAQRKPTFLATYDPHEIMPIFNLDPEDALPGYPLQTVSTGTPQLMIPVKGHEALRKAKVHISEYESLRESSDFFSPHLFCLEGITEAGHTFARHFGVPPDIIEDPFTGSATGGMGAYLWRNGLIEVPEFIAEQGHWMGRPGHARVEVIGDPEDIETVRVGGTAVTVLSGELILS